MMQRENGNPVDWRANQQEGTAGGGDLRREASRWRDAWPRRTEADDAFSTQAVLTRGPYARAESYGGEQSDPELDAVPPGPHRPLRVMLVDDHKIVRQGLAGLLRIEEDLEIVGEASDGQMAIDLAREIHPDVIVMDVSMPRVNGIEATRRISAELPGTRIVGLSMHERDDMALAMQEAGAVAYLSKDGPTESLLEAIRGDMRN